MISASNCAYADTSLKAERSICFLTFCALGLAQLAANANAELYQKIEASFNITNLSADPFDYTVTDVRVEVGQPDSTTVWLPAFVDGGMSWKVRHTPTTIGLYQHHAKWSAHRSKQSAALIVDSDRARDKPGVCAGGSD